MRDVPFPLALQSPGLTCKISIHRLEDGGEGIVDDKVTRAVPWHGDLQLNLDEVSCSGLREGLPRSIGKDAEVATGNLQSVGGNRLLGCQLRLGGEFDPRESPGRGRRCCGQSLMKRKPKPPRGHFIIEGETLELAIGLNGDHGRRC